MYIFFICKQSIYISVKVRSFCSGILVMLYIISLFKKLYILLSCLCILINIIFFSKIFFTYLQANLGRTSEMICWRNVVEKILDT